MRRITTLLILVALALPACTSPPPLIKRDPPPDRPEDPDFKPGPEYFWKKGHWSFDASRDDYVWRTGYWEKERVNRIFIPGYWERQGDGWVWHDEYWEEKKH